MGRVHDHPLLHFARDGANFSLNSDDPTVIGTRLAAEYETVRSWGLTEAHLVRAVRERREREIAVSQCTYYIQCYDSWAEIISGTGTTQFFRNS